MKRFILALSFVASVLVLFGQGHTHIPTTFRFNGGPITIECKANEVEQNYTRYGFTTELFSGVDLITSAHGRKRLEAPLYLSEKQGWVTIVGRNGESVYFSIGYVPAYSNSTSLFNDIADCLSSVGAEAVLVDDASGYYSSQNVEGALQEVADSLTALRNDLNSIASYSDAIDTMYLSGNTLVTITTTPDTLTVDFSQYITPSELSDSLTAQRVLTALTYATTTQLDDSTTVLRALIDSATPDSALFVTLSRLTDSLAAIRADIPSADGVVTSGTVSGSTLSLSRSEGLSDVDIDVSSLQGGSSTTARSLGVLATGQSNMNNTDNTLGDWTTDTTSQIQAIVSDEYETANPLASNINSHIDATPRNSIAWAFAKEAIRHREADTVKMLVHAVNSQPSWCWTPETSADGEPTTIDNNHMLDTIWARLNRAPDDFIVDVILYQQGERDEQEGKAFGWKERVKAFYDTITQHPKVREDATIILGYPVPTFDSIRAVIDSVELDLLGAEYQVFKAARFDTISLFNSIHYDNEAYDEIGKHYFSSFQSPKKVYADGNVVRKESNSYLGISENSLIFGGEKGTIKPISSLYYNPDNEGLYQSDYTGLIKPARHSTSSRNALSNLEGGEVIYNQLGLLQAYDAVNAVWRNLTPFFSGQSGAIPYVNSEGFLNATSGQMYASFPNGLTSSFTVSGGNASNTVGAPRFYAENSLLMANTTTTANYYNRLRFMNSNGNPSALADLTNNTRTLGMTTYEAYLGSTWRVSARTRAKGLGESTATRYASEWIVSVSNTASGLMDMFSVKPDTLDAYGSTLINLADPTSAQDAATKNYVDTEISAKTGWAQYSDATFTSGSPLTVAAGDTITLPIDASSIIDTYLPDGVSSFWSAADSTITPENVGDAYTVRVSFTASSTSNDGYFTKAIDIGDGTPSWILSRISTFPKGSGTAHQFSTTDAIYTLSTFVANGGKIKIAGGVGTTSIWDISILITRTHKP